MNRVRRLPAEHLGWMLAAGVAAAGATVAPHSAATAVQFRELGIADRDIRLALYIPDAALGRLQDPAAGKGTIGCWLRPLLALALALGLGLLTFWILRVAEAPGWRWSAPALLLGVLACWLMLRGRAPRTSTPTQAPG